MKVREFAHTLVHEQGMSETRCTHVGQVSSMRDLSRAFFLAVTENLSLGSLFQSSLLKQWTGDAFKLQNKLIFNKNQEQMVQYSKEIKGRTALITGASKVGGIGAAIAQCYAAQGANVIIAARSQEGLDEVR